MKGSVLMLTVLLAIIREHEAKVKVSLLPRFPVVYVGDYIHLVCSVNQKKVNTTVRWFINSSPSPHDKPVMPLAAVTPEDGGEYVCEHGGIRSAAFTLAVRRLEAPAQLSPAAGGSVLFSGEDKLLTLWVEDELKGWRCFVFRNDRGYGLDLSGGGGGRRTASLYATLDGAPVATFWCLHNETKDRSNGVTLRSTSRLVALEPPAAPVLMGDSVALRCAVWGKAEIVKVVFSRGNVRVSAQNTDKYIIEEASHSNGGQYTCNATYRYSHISPAAQIQTVGSDPQTLKVIDGPPAPHLSVSDKGLRCSYQQHPDTDCRTYHWYQTDESHTRKRIAETSQDFLYNEDPGVYSCRVKCKDGFSRFSKEQKHKGGASSQMGGIVAALLIVFGLLIVLFVAVKFRQYRRNRVRAIEQGKGDRKKDTGGDYEQIGLTNNAIYHTLGEAADPEKSEGGYEALKKTEGEKGVYHTLGEAADPKKSEGGYEPLKKMEMGVYHTLDQSKGESQAGYEALQTVKAQVYQTLSSTESKKPEGEVKREVEKEVEGEAEGGYEKLPQKTKDHKDIEENPYEELKGEKQGKKK